MVGLTLIFFVKLLNYKISRYFWITPNQPEMNFLIKLPVNYQLDMEEKIKREARFQMAFKSLIYKYSDHEMPFEKNASFNVDHEVSGHYLRLKTLSSQYPKEMQEEIVDTFSRVFIGS